MTIFRTGHCVPKPVPFAYRSLVAQDLFGPADRAASFTLREAVVRDDFDERNGTGAVPQFVDSIIHSLAEDSLSVSDVFSAASRVPRFLRFVPDNIQGDAAFPEQCSSEGIFFPQNSEE